MDLKVSTSSLDQCFINSTPVQGCSLRINAFHAKIKKRGYSLEYVANFLDIPLDALEQRIADKGQFREAEIKRLIRLMNVNDVFFSIYFSSFEERQRVYEATFLRKMKVKKRNRRKKRERNKKTE